MLAGDNMCPVTRYFIGQGIYPEVAYFGASDFQIGWRIQAGSMELVYRYEGGELIICDFAARRGNSGGAGAVSAFISLIHRIAREVGEVRSVRGMFRETVASPDINRARRRLARILEAQGAKWVELEGGRWLVYAIS